MPQRRGLVPVLAGQQYSVSPTTFVGLVRWASAAKAANFSALVFANGAAEKRGGDFYGVGRGLWVTDLY